MHSAVVLFRNTVISKGINSLHLCNFYSFITTLLCNNINRNDMLGLLLDLCYTVPTLMYVLWKVMRVTAIELWFLDSEHLYWSYYDGGAVAMAGSAITFLIITLMLFFLPPIALRPF